ncbi:MAG: hypothetical protein ACTSXT_03720 [Candidatus Helarchaeota archaeon]
MDIRIIETLATIGIFGLGILLIFLIWNYLSWYSLIIVVPIIIILEIYILNKIDDYYVIKKKTKLIQLGVISQEEREIRKPVIDEFENYKNKVNQSIKNLNNILIDMDDVYNEALFLIEDGEIFNARKKFKSMLARANKDIEQEDIKVISLTNKALETANPTLNMSIKNYKELWDKTRIDILKKIKDIADKFKIRSELESQIKKIFKFEIDNNRPVSENDLDTLELPLDQYRRLLRIIEKPVKIDIKKMYQKEKQRMGEISKKVISVCMKNGITPNLAYLFYALQIDLKTSKEILSYLKNIGMIDVIFYHIVPK